MLRALARRWWARAFAALVLVIVAFVAVLHTPPARRAVLARAIATLEDRLNLILRAEELRYNLFALRVTLLRVTLSSITASQTPFLTADVLIIDLPWSALFGPFAIENIAMENARVRIARGADGATNLPPSQESTGESAPVPIGRISIPRLAVDVSDQRSGVVLTLPGVAVDVGDESGTVRLLSSGRVQYQGKESEISRLGGDASFDGRALHLRSFALAANEGSLTVDGTIAFLAADPRVELEIVGRTDVDRVTSWVLETPRPAGELMFSGGVRGALAAPSLTFDVRSDALTYERLTASAISGHVVIDESRLQLTGLEAGLAAGRVKADADVMFGSSEITVTGTWTDLDMTSLVRTLAPEVTPRPSGRTTGMLTGKGTASDLTQWELNVSNRMAAGRAGPNLLPVGGTATLRTSAGNWNLRATPSVAGVPADVNLRGRLAQQIASSSVNGLVRINETELTELMSALSMAGVLEPSSEITGRMRADVGLSGTLEAPVIDANAHLSGVTAQEVKDIEGDLIANGTLRNLAVEAQIRQGTSNTVQATGTVFPQNERIDFRATGHLGDLASLANVPIGGAADLTFEGAGPFTAITGRGTVRVSDLVYENTVLGPLESGVELNEGTAHITASLTEFGANADATLTLAEPYNTTVDVRVTEADLARVLRDQSLPAMVTGVASLTAHAMGSLNDWQRGAATVDISRLEAKTGELDVRLLAPAQATYRDGIASINSLEAALDETHLSVGGSLPVLETAASVPEADALRATLTGDLAQALEALRSAGFIDLPPVSGRGPLVLLARVTGSAQQPALSANFELGPGTVALAEWPAIEPLQLRARLNGGWLELDQAEAEWQDARISATGRMPVKILSQYLPADLIDALPPAPGDASLNATLTSLGPNVLVPFLDTESITQLEGTVDATLQLGAASLELAHLRGEARLDRLDLRISNLPVTQRQPTRIVFEDGFARVAAWDWIGEGANLGVQGRVGLEKLEASLQADGRVDLRVLTPFVRGAGIATAGTLQPRVNLTGTLENPSIDGSIELAAGEVRLADPRIVASGLTARAVLSRQAIDVPSITGTVNGGPLNGKAHIEYGANQPVSAEASATIQRMPLNFPEGLRTEMNADLNLQLAEDPALETLGGTLSGTVTVLRGSYREQLAVATALLTRMRTERVASIAAPTTESVADRLALNVRVVTDDEIRVDNNYGRLELGGDLRVIGTAGAPALSGRAILQEGGQLFLGRNTYTIEPGATIDFANPVTIEPNLNIVATTRAGGREIELTIMGPPANLSVVPRVPDDPSIGVADAWSLLLTGRTLDEVSGDEAEIVGEQVLGYVSGDVLGMASRVVGLDTIRLGGIEESELRRDPTVLATEVDPTSRLTFGESIGEKVDLTFSQSLRDSNAQTWIVDYAPIRQLGLRFVTDDDDLRAYEFRHDVSFGDDSRRRAPREDRPEPRVTDVTVTGSLGLPEQRVRDALRLEVGDRFDFVEWQRDRDRLEEMYREAGFREVRIDAQRNESGDQVGLSYAIESGPPTAIVITGYELSRQTREAIERAWDGAVFEGFLVDDATALVRQAVAEDGYLRAEVSSSVEFREGVKTLSTAIAPGARTTDFRVRLESKDETLARELDGWMRDQKLAELAWRDPGALEEGLTGEVRRRGHLQADVTVGAVSFEGSSATLPVSINAGPVFTVSDVQLQGARIRYDATLNAVNIEAGAPFDPAAVDAARDRAITAYRRAGFSEARATARPEIATETRQVRLVFEIEEGPRQVLQEVVVTGNRGIDEDVVTRALGVDVGDPLGPDAWLEARSRIFETGLFRRVDLTVDPIEKVDSSAATQPMRVQVTVQEWPRLRLRYGFAVEEQRPAEEVDGRDLVPGISADVTRRTLFGRAISVVGAIQYQRRTQLARGLINAPTFMTLPIESTLTVERSREEFAAETLITNRTGVSWEQRFRLARRLRLSYSYRFDKDHTFDTGPPDPIFGPFDVTANVARFTTTAAYDTRDSPSDTTRGWLLSSSLDYAPKAAGSEFRFVRDLTQAYYFRPWRGMVLASAARVGLATGLDGQELIPSERFFTGGARSVRGAAEDRLGPRDALGDPTGGEALLVLNQELRFPIYRWFRGVVFTDAGNVFPSVSNFSLRDLEGSAGFGLRLVTPFALLRVDYGRLFSPGPSDGSGRWTFGIGQTF